MAGVLMEQVISNIPITNPNQYRKLRYKPATLYYLRIVFPMVSNNGTNGQSGEVAGTVPLILYKLGYTTTSLMERVHGKQATYYWSNGKRVRAAGHTGMGLPKDTQVYVIAAYQHGNASLVYQWEQYLHGKYRESKWQGLPVMGNGNTELYVSDILGLDN